MAVGAMFKAQELAVAPILSSGRSCNGDSGPPSVADRPHLRNRVIASGWMLTYLPADNLAAARHAQEYTDVASYPPDLFAIPRVFDVPAAIWICELILVAAVTPWILRNLLLPIDPPPRAVSRLKPFCIRDGPGPRRGDLVTARPTGHSF